MRSDAKLQAPSKTEQSPHLLNEPSRLCFLACINHSYLFFSEVLDLPPSVERMAKTISTRPKENKGHCLAAVQGLLKEGASGMKVSLPPFVFRWLALTLGLHAALAKLETCSGFLFLLFDVRIETPESFSVFMMFFLLFLF